MDVRTEWTRKMLRRQWNAGGARVTPRDNGEQREQQRGERPHNLGDNQASSTKNGAKVGGLERRYCLSEEEERKTRTKQGMEMKHKKENSQNGRRDENKEMKGISWKRGTVFRLVNCIEFIYVAAQHLQVWSPVAGL